MDGKFLGKIAKAQFGIQDSNFGLTVTFSGPDFNGTGFVGTWGLAIAPSHRTEWNENDRDGEFANLCRFVNQTLIDAKVDDVAGLEGVPVEVTIKGGVLESWRILTEVL